MAEEIKQVVSGYLTSHPGIEYLVIVGDDLMIPFYRVPDDAHIANESVYTLRSQVNENNPTYAALNLGYILTDDFYALHCPGRQYRADHTPLKWRGRELFAPDLAIGRLVETPEEIETLIVALHCPGRQYRAFSGRDPLAATTAFVSGYDFLMDSAEAISDTLGSAGMTLTTLISDTWTAAQLQNDWLNSPQDLASVNAHFDHWQAIPAMGATMLDTSDVASAANMSGTVNFSMGCHSGFSVHDDHAIGGYPLDFAQALHCPGRQYRALARNGAWWIGNTGYGYGMDDSIALTEQLMHFFTQKLVSAPNVPVGEALRWAKNRYLGGVPSGGFGTYDEKAMIESTLYGLPMYRVSSPTAPISNIQYPIPNPQSPIPNLSANGLATVTVSFDLSSSLQLETGSEYGDYYTIGGEVQANPGRPVQPRTSKPVPVKSGQTVHGAVLLNATSVLIEAFDSLVARPVTDTALYCHPGQCTERAAL